MRLRLMAKNTIRRENLDSQMGRVIAEHSVREFKFEKDRLASLRSLEREVTKAMNNSRKPDTYFFSTWLIDIPEHILWASYRLGKVNTFCPLVVGLLR